MEMVLDCHSVTTLGTAREGASVVMLEAGGEWRRSAEHRLRRWSVWAAALHPGGDSLALATSTGGVLLGLDPAWQRDLCRSSSAVLAVEGHPQGSLVMLGFRNGVISTVDLRLPMPLPQQGVSPPFSLYCSHAPIMRMPSSVCSLRLLSDDKYLLAAALNGVVSTAGLLLLPLSRI